MFFKKAKLERQLMAELKEYAHVDEFPYEDAMKFAKLVNAYNQGNGMINMTMMAYGSTIRKYPELAKNWDRVFIKYKKLGLFPGWDVVLIEDDE